MRSGRGVVTQGVRDRGHWPVSIHRCYRFPTTQGCANGMRTRCQRLPCSSQEHRVLQTATRYGRLQSGSSVLNLSRLQSTASADTSVRYSIDCWQTAKNPGEKCQTATTAHSRAPDAGPRARNRARIGDIHAVSVTPVSCPLCRAIGEAQSMPRKVSVLQICLRKKE